MTRSKEDRIRVRKIALELIEKRKRNELKYEMKSREEWLKGPAGVDEETRNETIEIRKKIVNALENKQ